MSIINETDRVVFEGDWAEGIIYGHLWDESETISEFNELFEIDEAKYLADPDESWYQGVEFMRVIKRKADGRLFGYQFWKPVAKYDEVDLDPNGDDHGFESTYNADYSENLTGPFGVWLPVEPFTVTGYRIATPSQEVGA